MKLVGIYLAIKPKSANHNNCRLLCLLPVTLKFIAANSVDPRSDCSFKSSLIWVHTVCLYAKCKFEKFARRCSRRHKQTTFSDADFLGALRVNTSLVCKSFLSDTFCHLYFFNLYVLPYSIFTQMCRTSYVIAIALNNCGKTYKPSDDKEKYRGHSHSTKSSRRTHTL